VFDPVTNIECVPAVYRATKEREAIKVMIAF
jgi:hypothetical protein